MINLTRAGLFGIPINADGLWQELANVLHDSFARGICNLIEINGYIKPSLCLVFSPDNYAVALNLILPIFSRGRFILIRTFVNGGTYLSIQQ